MTLNIILAVVVFLNISLSLFVLSQDFRSVNNRFFALLSLLSGLWTLANFMTGVHPFPFWLESTYAFGGLVIATGIIWILVVIEQNFNRKKSLVIFSIFFIFSLLSYYPGFIATRYDQIFGGGVFIGETGWGLVIYTVAFLIAAIYILLKLYVSYKHSPIGQKKSQLISIFYGTLILVIISAMTSFVLPSISVFSFGGLDSIGLLFFLFFIAYAMTKHHLFDIKVITTEIITFALWIFIFIRTVIADNVQDQIINAVLLLLMLVFGTLLIKSVIREVNQREKIEKLAADLKKANTRLLDLDKQKSEFVSFATHQLRAPLTAMKGYTSLILEGEYGKISDETKKAISTIYESAKTLTVIVNDYLNISRIELGSMKYNFEMIDMKQMVGAVITELKPNIDKKGLKLSFSTIPNNAQEKFMIHADMDKFKQVIVNLIDNSVKYTPQGTIDVTLTKNPVDRKILLAIKDTGVGIAEEVMPKLFSKFTRAENANKQNIYGTGLGLFVAKEIVEAHRGRVWAESDGEGKGSTFNVEMVLEN